MDHAWSDSTRASSSPVRVTTRGVTTGLYNASIGQVIAFARQPSPVSDPPAGGVRVSRRRPGRRTASVVIAFGRSSPLPHGAGARSCVTYRVVSDEAPAEAARLVGRPVMVSRRQLILMVVLTISVVVFVVWQHQYLLLLYPAFLVVNFTRVIEQPPSVVTAGVSRPWQWRSRIDWDEVASVAAPEAGKRGSKLNLTDGKAVALLDIPADQAAAVAVIGGKEVAAPQYLQRPSIPGRPKTDMEVEADVRRRAEALAVQRQQLAAESRRLGGGH